MGLNPGSAWWFLPKASAVVFASFLAADSVNAVIASALAAPETAPLSVPPPQLAARSRSLDYFLEPIVRRNVFRHGEPVPGEEAAAQPLASQPEEGCTLPIQVLATVVVPRTPHLSLATLLDASTKRIFVVQVGERVLDLATLAAVEEPWDETVQRKDSVVVLERDDGSRFVCRSDDAPAAPAPRGGAVPAVAAGNGVRRVAEGQYEIPQAEVDAVMNGGLATVATTVRIVPYFESGKSAGFKLYSVKAGSLLSKLGLVNGDILRKVNGYEIYSPEKALEVYGILKSERNVTLDVTRGGQPRTFQYAIR